MLRAWVHHLTSPYLVADFQRLCGVELATSTRNNNVEQGRSTRNNNNNSYHQPHGALHRASGTAESSSSCSNGTSRLLSSSSSSSSSSSFGSIQQPRHRKASSPPSADDGQCHNIKNNKNNNTSPLSSDNTPTPLTHTYINSVTSNYGCSRQSNGVIDNPSLPDGVTADNGSVSSQPGYVSTPPPQHPDTHHPSSYNSRTSSTRSQPGVEDNCEGKSASFEGDGDDEGEGEGGVVIRYPMLYYWAKLGAYLGNEEFYLTVMPFLLWTVDACLVRQVAVLWWAVMWVGQVLKDLLQWPRPSSPPVTRLETQYLAEHAMPSTHAMAGTAMPLLMGTLVLHRYQVPVVVVVGVAVLWCFTTCLSRLYLGVHTVLDVLVGFLLSVIMFLALSPLIPALDLHVQTHPLAPLLLLPASLTLCTLCYPTGGSTSNSIIISSNNNNNNNSINSSSSSRSNNNNNNNNSISSKKKKKTSAKGDAIIITAVLAGVGLGSWLNFQLGLSQMVPKDFPLPVSMPSWAWLVMSVLQFVVGVAVVFALKAALKPLMVRVFTALLLGRGGGGGGGGGEDEGVMVGYRYVTYLSLGLAMTFLDPLIFTALGFGRPGYYSDVL